mmetsp:Transcript_20488/g.40036  ORF Transcript_20488/g.40036 Transcript_20488/m.40036 type:complete len:200 (+) Transcript_20488:248-847(+)
MFNGALPISARHSGDTFSSIGTSACRQNAKPFAGHMSRPLWLRQKVAFTLLWGSRQLTSTSSCTVCASLPSMFAFATSDGRDLAVGVAFSLREAEFPWPPLSLVEQLREPTMHKATTTPTKASMRHSENLCLLQASSAELGGGVASSVAASSSGSGAGSGTSSLGFGWQEACHEPSSLTSVNSSTSSFLPTVSPLCVLQ